MCTVSMVHDHYNEDFSKKYEWWLTPGTRLRDDVIAMKDAEIAALKKEIEEYREALAAAKRVDELTKQPDCVDPDKAKLQEQVARLEKIVDALLAERKC